MNSTICEAIKQKRIIQFRYEGELRIIEPHCHGITTAGNEGLRAYQINGYSSSGKMGWKMYDLSKSSNVELLNNFIGPRLGYKRNDRGMSTIYCEL